MEKWIYGDFTDKYKTKLVGKTSAFFSGPIEKSYSL